MHCHGMRFYQGLRMNSLLHEITWLMVCVFEEGREGGGIERWRQTRQREAGKHA